MRTAYDDMISEMAWNAKVDRALVQAIVCQESRGMSWTSKTKESYLSNKVVIVEARAWSRSHRGSPDSLTERTLRATSWGLMQIMGQVAREAGYKHDWLTRLLDPEENVALGCQLLRARVDKLGDESWVIKSWNAGTGTRRPLADDPYVVDVQRFISETPYA